METQSVGGKWLDTPCRAFIKELNMKIPRSMYNGLIRLVMKAWKLLRKRDSLESPKIYLEMVLSITVMEPQLQGCKW